MKRLLMGLVILCLLPTLALAASPYFIETPASIAPGSNLLFTFFAPEDALCDLIVEDADGEMAAAITQEYEAMFGANSVTWDGTYWGNDVLPGDYTLALIVGEERVETTITVNERAVQEQPPAQVIEEPEEEELPEPEGYYPAMNSPYTCNHENCYWRTPMDIQDEETVWNMLMAPMTVLDGDQKDQVLLRAEPSEDAEVIGEITCYSQGVHVLEHLDNGWSLIECHSSSFTYSKIAAWNAFQQGYVPTRLLKERQVGNTEYAMVVDKLTQRLYIFQNGEIIADLLVSTGLGTEDSPYNETRTGEFFLVSAVGEFPSGKLSCSYGIRFNDGDILHEVPHIKRGDTKVYETTEPKLGSKASHGCIRVQRLKNQDGINMNWIWNKLYKSVAKKNVKLVIWEDYPGRQLEYPDDDLVLYYNDDGGKNYHRGENCYGVRAKFLPLSMFTYGQFAEEPYAALTQCPYCSPVLKVEQIDAINAAHAE